MSECDAVIVSERELRLRAEIERLTAASDAAFYAMCAFRDSRDEEVFQDAIDALGVALERKRPQPPAAWRI